MPLFRRFLFWDTIRFPEIVHPDLQAKQKPEGAYNTGLHELKTFHFHYHRPGANTKITFSK